MLKSRRTVLQSYLIEAKQQIKCTWHLQPHSRCLKRYREKEVSSKQYFFYTYAFYPLHQKEDHKLIGFALWNIRKAQLEEYYELHQNEDKIQAWINILKQMMPQIVNISEYLVLSRKEKKADYFNYGSSWDNLWFQKQGNVQRLFAEKWSKKKSLEEPHTYEDLLVKATQSIKDKDKTIDAVLFDPEIECTFFLYARPNRSQIKKRYESNKIKLWGDNYKIKIKKNTEAKMEQIIDQKYGKKYDSLEKGKKNKDLSS